MDNELPTPLSPGIRLDTAVFLCGAAVMTFEIIGSRIVAPYIGTSTYVWTSLIGVILAALSLGYWYGGRLSDRHPQIGILASVIFVAAGLIALTTLLKDFILTAVSAVSIGIELKAVVGALLLFAPASFALGIVTPFAVKLRLSALGSAGNTVGRLYALSTVGSIVGTFAAGFVLIPFLGSLRCLYLIAVILFVASLILVPFTASRRNIAILVLFVFSILMNEAIRIAEFNAAGMVDVDTRYNRVRIFNAVDPETKRPIRALSFDPFATQSAMFVDSDDLVFEYSKFYHLARILNPGFRKSLIIGGAGYSFPKSYVASYPEATLDVVEIDPDMTRLAREYFRLRDSPRMSIFHEDGRTYLNRSPAAVYDVVFLDAFNTLFSVPFQLTTIEAVANVRRVLKPNGVVLFNMGSAITGDGSKFLQAEIRTYREIFPYVYLFKIRPERADTDLQNIVVVACQSSCLPQDVADPAIASLLSRRYTGNIASNEATLTDDLAPVERYMSIAQATSR